MSPYGDTLVPSEPLVRVSPQVAGTHSLKQMKQQTGFVSVAAALIIAVGSVTACDNLGVVAVDYSSYLNHLNVWLLHGVYASLSLWLFWLDILDTFLVVAGRVFVAFQ